MMSSAAMDSSDMMQINDEPLDLSLDKSKCRRQEREAAAAAQTVMKRAKTKSVVVRDDLVDDDNDVAVPGGEDREPDEDGEQEMWSADMMGQPHQQQMAASLYMMMQSYLASRLLQNSEAMRYQESQGRRGGDGEDGSSEDVGDDGSAMTNDPMAVAAAAAAAVGLLSHHQLPQMESITGHPASKRRKKDHGQSGLASDDPTANGARPRKTRTTFTGKQLFELERIFEQKKYLSSNERQEVARLLNVTGSQIKIWFQNRRTKWKKQDPSTAAELDQLKSASRSSSSQQNQPQQHHPTASKAGSSTDPTGLGPTDEEAHSDESSPSGPSSPL